MNTIRKIWDLFEDITSGTFLGLGILIIFYGVVMRYIFNDPKSWIEEIASYMIIWGILFGLSVALRNNRHIQVDLLYNKMPNSIKRILDIVVALAGITFCFLFIYYGFLLLLRTYSTGVTSMNVGIPMWIIYIILPVSGLMFALRFIEKFIFVLRGKPISS